MTGNPVKHSGIATARNANVGKLVASLAPIGRPGVGCDMVRWLPSRVSFCRGLCARRALTSTPASQRKCTPCSHQTIESRRMPPERPSSDSNRKTGATVWHPYIVDGAIVQFYPEAEAILANLPRRGVPMILLEIKTRSGVAFKPFSYGGFEKIVQQLRKKIGGLPSHFTLDACRHGGMTELEEAALRRPRPRTVRAQDCASLSRLREGNVRPSIVGHAKASRAPACERTADKRSE